MKRVAIFGGSFDPPHLGHKALVLAAWKALDVDEVWVIPVGLPVHKQLNQTISATQRLAWVQSMFVDIPYVQVLDLEVRQAKPVAAIETMRKLSAVLSDTQVWLMGTDAWNGLPDWVDYPEHRSLCSIAVLDRKDEVLEQHEGWVVSDCLKLAMQAGRMCFIEADLPNVSATNIRKMISRGSDVSMLLDENMAVEIQAAYGIVNRGK
ncbi:MAG: nicotinate (nicotinamide) nucleotide adenylyltransferase [Mariprofundaceae bacterium]